MHYPHALKILSFINFALNNYQSPVSYYLDLHLHIIVPCTLPTHLSITIPSTIVSIILLSTINIIMIYCINVVWFYLLFHCIKLSGFQPQEWCCLHMLDWQIGDHAQLRPRCRFSRSCDTFCCNLLVAACRLATCMLHVASCYLRAVAARSCIVVVIGV